MKANYIREMVMKVIFFIAACASVLAVILISLKDLVALKKQEKIQR